MGSHPTGGDDGAVDVADELLRALSAREGVAPSELDPPLYSVVDVEALERLFRKPVGEGNTPVGHVEFSYRDYKVVVHSDGTFQVHRKSPATP